jgi:hypothetical protein
MTQLVEMAVAYAALLLVAASPFLPRVSAGGVITIVGFLLSIWLLAPTVSIVQQPAVRPTEFLTPFVITNEGPLSIYDVRLTCHLTRIDLRAGGSTMHLSNNDVLDISITQQLDAKRSATGSCGRSMVAVMTVVYADVTASFSYWTWITGPREVRQRDEGGRDASGNLRWLPVGEDHRKRKRAR